MKNITKILNPIDTPLTLIEEKSDLEGWFNWLEQLCKHPDSTESRELNPAEAAWLFQKLAAEELRHDAYLYADRL